VVCRNLLEKFGVIMLLMHLALECKKPLDILRLLVQQWPESVEVLNDKKEVALHRECQNNQSLPVVQFLVEQWPEALQLMSFDGLLFASRLCFMQIHLLRRILDSRLAWRTASA